MKLPTNKLLRGAAASIFAVALINFAAYMIVGVKLGGFANIGRVDGGRYFLGNHGKYTEVSPAVYNYSLIHGRTTVITHALAFAFGIPLVLMQIQKRRERPKSA